ncbi:MBOAT family O-acyltransferase [Cohnella boryungensis]
MIFTSFSYFFFITISVFLYYLGGTKTRKFILAISGIIFYAYFAREYIVLLFLESIVIYWMAKRVLWFIPGLMVSIGILCLFKYLEYATNIINLVFGKAFISPQITIPLAISFFTFEFVHYLVDSYKEKIPKHNFLEYMGFIFFFPTMVAGPIKRFQHFTSQLDKRINFNDLQAGCTRILIGIAKKVVIADTMNIWPLQLTDQATATDLWIGVVAFTIKIYADFSAYSDIAIGSARCFGIVVPENFNYPYLARNISDFWKRWHISLSRWITDYIFIPLGGSRVALPLILMNTMIAMGISGLWHGAATHFVAWGLYHGALLCIVRLYTLFVVNRFPVLTKRAFGFFSWMVTMASVMFGWMLFNMPLYDILPALKIMLGVG